MFRTIRNKWQQGRRGAVVVLVAVVSTVMVGFVAMTVDLGTIYIARTELQRAADAASLAGASIYLGDAGLAGQDADLIAGASERSKAIAIKNPVYGAGQILANSDVQLGQHDFANPAAALLPGSPWNAVEVKVHRDVKNPNGPVPLLFARIWGKTASSMTAVARATLDDRMAGYKLEGNASGVGFMPFTIPASAFYNRIGASGSDHYSYDDGVETGTDGVPEVEMYPWKWTATDGPEGSGNFGLLDLNCPKNGASALAAQISSGGASAADVQIALGTSTLAFYDATHTESNGPNTYSCSGEPGMKTSLQKALSEQVGKVFGFFLNNGVHEHGSHATYSICGMFFGRIMAVDISGGKNAEGLVIQPVAYTDPWVIISADAASSHGTVGRLTLVR
jgi:Flp pilus assembly protein TadG